jgi:hypothetical protein
VNVEGYIISSTPSTVNHSKTFVYAIAVSEYDTTVGRLPTASFLILQKTMSNGVPCRLKYVVPFEPDLRQERFRGSVQNILDLKVFCKKLLWDTQASFVVGAEGLRWCKVQKYDVSARAEIGQGFGLSHQEVEDPPVLQVAEAQVLFGDKRQACLNRVWIPSVDGEALVRGFVEQNSSVPLSVNGEFQNLVLCEKPLSTAFPPVATNEHLLVEWNTLVKESLRGLLHACSNLFTEFLSLLPYFVSFLL